MDKCDRILDMYSRLSRGRMLIKSDEAQKFGVDLRTVQRDIDSIRAFLSTQSAEQGEQLNVEYDRSRGGYLLTGHSSPLMTGSETLAVSKILLESRAFTKSEIETVLEKIISGCVDKAEKKAFKAIIANEMLHYAEIKNPAGIPDRLWELASQLKNRRLCTFSYSLQDTSKPPVKRIVEPLAVMFSEYYFYLNAYIAEKNSDGKYVHKYEYPAIFRIDRISGIHFLEQTFSLPYANRFEEGEFRKRIQFMYTGKLYRIKFRFKGDSLDAVMDRLPTAKIISSDDNGAIITAEVYGKGFLMWLLSQGAWAELLSPCELRKELAGTISKLYKMYSEE